MGLFVCENFLCSLGVLLDALTIHLVWLDGLLNCLSIGLQSSVLKLRGYLASCNYLTWYCGCGMEVALVRDKGGYTYEKNITDIGYGGLCGVGYCFFRLRRVCSD